MSNGFKINIKNKGLKLGWKYLWKHRKGVFKIVAISLFGAVLGAFVPLIFGKLVEVAQDPKISIFTLLGLVFLWAAVDQIHSWTTRFVDKNGIYISWDAQADLFIDGMRHLIRLPMTFLTNQRLGKVMQRIDRSAEYLERDIREVVFSLFPHFTTAMLGLSFALYLDWRLGILLLIIVICYVLAMISKSKIILVKTREARKMWENCWGYLWDIINNVKSVKSNTNEIFEENRIEKNYTASFKKEKEIEEIRTQLKTREHLIFGLGAVLVLSVGVYFFRIGTITAGGLISFIWYLNLIYQPFSRLSHNWRLVQESAIALERTANFLEMGREDYQSGDHYEIVGNIEFKNASFAYEHETAENGERARVLRGINFKVNQGETVALVGESGVGKTTLVDLISRYFDLIEGAILIDGRDIRQWSLSSLRSQIASVPQDVTLFNDTIKLNIGYGDIDRMDSPEEIKRAAKFAYADEFIEAPRFKDGYDQIVGERGIKVSTGQRQRIAFARAIIRSNKLKILILDEVTSALDSKSEKYIQESLNELKKGKTTLIIAHRLSTIKNADKIVVLNEGGIAEIGTHQELIARGGVYKQFVDLQSLDA